MERNLAISLWMVDLRHGMPSQSPSGKSRKLSQKKRLSFVKQTDSLFFRQSGALSSDEDPLSELLASAAELNVPDNLVPATGGFGENYERPMLGSAAIVFERKESRMSFRTEEPGRKQSSMAVRI